MWKTAYDVRIDDWSSDVCSSDLTLELFGIGLVEPIDLADHIGALHRPVEIAIGHVPAEAPGIVQILGEMRAVDEQLLGHAAPDHAGAADAVFLGDRHLRAMRRRQERKCVV